MADWIYACDDDDNLYADARVLTSNMVIERIKYESTKDALDILAKIQEELGWNEHLFRQNNIQSIIDMAKRFPKGFFTDSPYYDLGWTT